MENKILRGNFEFSFFLLTWSSYTLERYEWRRDTQEIYRDRDLSFFFSSHRWTRIRDAFRRDSVKSSQKFGGNPLAGWQGAKLNVVRDKRHYGDARRFIFLWLARFLRPVTDETIVWFIEKDEIPSTIWFIRRLVS